MPYLNDQHLNFCWKTPYKKVILDAVAENSNEDLYGSYPESTMTIHAGCGWVPVLEEETPIDDGGTPTGPYEDESAVFYSGLFTLWSLVLYI